MQKSSLVISLFLFLVYQTSVYANNSEFKILILGDSLSAAHNIPIDKSWPQLFSNYIRSSFPQTSVINSSISGETTYGGLRRINQLINEHHPSHLIIELGGNDGLRGLDFNQTTDNLRQMMSIALDQQIKILLIGVRMPPNLGVAYNIRFQKIFETVAQETGAAYLPRFLEGVAAGDPSMMQSDGIHPSEIAQPILAEKVTAEVLLLLKNQN
jgi:acyl-CoA thioesterase-1